MKGQFSIIALSAAFLAISQCWAESGDTLYVQKNGKVESMAGSSMENSLRDDYALFEERRRGLENERKKYEKMISTLEDSWRSVEQKYEECTGKGEARWGVRWKETMDDVEKSRKELEDMNKTPDQINVDLAQINVDLGQINVELEKERRAIEDSHRIKGRVYESEIRRWMQKVDREYFLRLERELFRGYKNYMSGIKIHITIIEGVTTKCHNNNYTDLIRDFLDRSPWITKQMAKAAVFAKALKHVISKFVKPRKGR